jgi:hypothetical protein
LIILDKDNGFSIFYTEREHRVPLQHFALFAKTDNGA